MSSTMPTLVMELPAILIIAFSILLAALLILYFGQIGGRPSKFQVHRVFYIAMYLEQQIESALKEGTLDVFGNLNVVARNRQFLTYRGFLERDVEHVTRIMADKKGFTRGYVDFGPKVTTFRFKLKS